MPLIHSEETRLRFWVFVERRGPDECWPWMGGTDDKGYGRFWLDGASRKAHRLAWELTNGRILTDDDVLHDCDNRPCCNPAHLHPGTHADNMAEMYARGRRDHRKISGELNGSAHLTGVQVDEVRIRLAAGESQRSLGRAFGVDKRTIARIRRGETWATRGVDAG